MKKNLNLIDRIVYFVVGMVLLIPIVNFVAQVGVNRFATQNHKTKYEDLSLRPDHTGGGVLPYWVNEGVIYFLLSKEGFGSAKNTWCDFGGAKDRGETLLDSAARECWEESRGILGDLKTIRKKISQSAPIGKKYGMFFLEVDRSQDLTNNNFVKRTFSDFHRMEKTEIAWVKADDVFKAVISGDRVSSSIELRGFFAETLSEALKNPREKAVIEKMYRKVGLIFQAPKKSWSSQATKVAAVLAFGFFVSKQISL